MNSAVFNLRQLQDTKTFLTLCESMSTDEALHVIEQEITDRVKELPDSKPTRATNSAPNKPCPSCGTLMREEDKSGEFVWHCLNCQHSEYIGFK